MFLTNCLSLLGRAKAPPGRGQSQAESGKREDPVGATNHQPGLIIPPNNDASIAHVFSSRNQVSPEKPHREWLIGFF
jgi:hypothetical protein